MEGYPAVCGICEEEFDIEAEFLSAPSMSKSGRVIVSGECPKQHSRDEIQQAYFEAREYADNPILTRFLPE